MQMNAAVVNLGLFIQERGYDIYCVENICPVSLIIFLDLGLSCSGETAYLVAMLQRMLSCQKT